jgi:Holliday junction resolvasome RuvABC endonuclease subunit
VYPQADGGGVVSILGIDPGYAKCGWSIVEPGTGRVIALGLITTIKRAGLHVSADRAARVAEVCDRVAELAHKHGATTFAVEQPLMFGASAAIAANLLPWGAVLMLARTEGIELLEISANEWQCAVLGIDPKVKRKFKKGEKYALVEKALYAYVGTQLANVLEGLDAKDRRHPLDATGSGMFAAFRPEQATRIIKRREAA